MKVTIGGIPYQIKFVENLHSDGDDLLGQIDHGELEIHLDETVPGALIPVILWHEVLHGINKQTALNLDETTVIALAYQVVEILKNNPLLNPQVTFDLLNGEIL